MNENVNHIVPDTWCLERLGDFVISEKGKKPKNISKVKTKTHHLPYVNIRAFEKNIVDEYTDGVGCVLCEENDFLMVWDGSRSGYIGKAIKGALGSTLVKINFPGIVNDYAYYFLQSKYLQINTRAKGTGTPHVDPGLLWNYQFPIAPYNEQKRVVEKIEELFSDLDKGVEILSNTLKQLKVYRNAVLKWAYEVNLNETGLPISFHVNKLGNYLLKIEAGKSYKCEERPPKGNDYGIVKVSSVTWGEFDEEESKTCLNKDQINKNYLIKEGDFLFSRANTLELVGACVIVKKFSKKLMLSDKIFRFQIADNLNKFYLLHYLRSSTGRKQIQFLSTGNQESMRNIGQEKIKQIEIPFCEPYEQLQIVQEIESRLSVCDKIEEMITVSLRQSEILRYSILKKAFEGKLVPQDPNDEPASILLQRIKADKEKNKPVKKEREKKPKSRTKMKQEV